MRKGDIEREQNEERRDFETREREREGWERERERG
jgi:hypothetical protein